MRGNIDYGTVLDLYCFYIDFVLKRRVYNVYGIETEFE